MKCLSKIEHYLIPNDIVVRLTKLYRFIGNNDFYINSLGNDINKVISLTVEKDSFYLCKILKLDISEARCKLILTKDSSPRNKEETTLYNIKEMLSGIQLNYQELGLQSNDLYNTINYIYSHYNTIKFTPIEENEKSKRKTLDDMNDLVNNCLQKGLYEKIILFIQYFIDLSNLKPFETRNKTLSLLILYQIILSSDLNCFKYVSFFEMLYNDYARFSEELCLASVNWKEGYSQTVQFVRYFLALFEKAYTNCDRLIKDYSFDRINTKHENIESLILSYKSIFTKDEIRQMYPYVSESTINRALSSLKDKNMIRPLGKGRSAKWARK